MKALCDDIAKPDGYAINTLKEIVFEQDGVMKRLIAKVQVSKIPRKSRASGAGVKAVDGALDLERKQVRLDPLTEEILLVVGDGNLSLGIREAARRLIAHHDTGVFIKKY